MKVSVIVSIAIYILVMVFTTTVVLLRPDLLATANTFLRGMAYSNLVMFLCVILGIMGRE